MNFIKISNELIIEIINEFDEIKDIAIPYYFNLDHNINKLHDITDIANYMCKKLNAIKELYIRGE